MKITIVAGARPNFIKIAPIIKAIEKKQIEGAKISFRLVHTGQHYDRNLSDTFFQELNIPKPNANLEVKSGSQSMQTATIMVAFEQELLQNPCDLVLVVGDVNSTMACAIVAKKLNIKVTHVEAGIRSGDMTMPEEINRIVTDSITDYFFTTSIWAGENLLKYGADATNIHFVGNVMIDTLYQNLDRISAPLFWNEFNLEPKNYIILTLHRPSNVDEEQSLIQLLQGIDTMVGDKKVIFPIHPRTKAILGETKLDLKNIVFVEPQGYLNFMFLIKNSFAVITDSGGISEETTVLGIPCFTMRNNTERPETQTVGTNTLVGTSIANLNKMFGDLLQNGTRKAGIPALWDGKASERIITILLSKK
ncbi:MAG TPA: UDP-N-acetylglucosamine 2-epimerase (non-hydrolyzing) [Flavobacterium sp.]|jgi:UDP-N-acetylglucosamine 2-epimerase (non-hydrolysing)|uniref:non-hydrolyzing UDP-N-acetylglucosamine 2-epimerase n=1 Tax=Flavobacterium sp. TaxID=239 RepID=UPI001B76D75F|nr:UDP-N-acetylglucosamine 2-epimerase (non-hydrolyzing) [Flavobacterium sp.]MBP7181731.1 UDP-N-acetylglucosamine 2-epimerase (non-hydrolyzing) [Flavobacterium sp.]MBP7318478.1 UDP-N-acetylglucosamine 2-epimerase (non-hydrolyzing) [Flavobacterium sp.]MBP8887453.1 UDP-N-acetylglucosamine 2-epimerase (non-hydrolyzing) [Flavobacterium sp.]HRL70950.1 UDP-N-acetylglucosamine 2-epimerase (non-hydrolyzing) [Flavobacterium sp.]HRM45615.1 UDP-N-acetylglucosamine 2-epimerase (non-hydrolyzing) [Flavobact